MAVFSSTLKAQREELLLPGVHDSNSCPYRECRFPNSPAISFVAYFLLQYQAFQLCMRCNSVISTKFHCFRADNSTSLCNSKRYLSVSSKQYAGSKDGEEKSDEAVPEEKPVSVKSRLVIVTVFALVGVAFFYYSNEKSKTGNDIIKSLLRIACSNPAPVILIANHRANFNYL